MTDYVRPIPIPHDGRPKRLDAGWFVAYLVRARDANGAAIQARIRAKIHQLQAIDVVQVVEQMPDDEVRPLWLVELQIEAPQTGELGI